LANTFVFLRSYFCAGLRILRAPFTIPQMNRRDFLATVPLALAASTLPISEMFAAPAAAQQSAAAKNPSLPTGAAASHELDFATALQAAEAIRAKKITSVELTERMFARIDRYNPQLNVFAYQLREDALAQAKKADAALAQGQSSGQSLGVLHGVPITVKESFAVAGHPCTWVSLRCVIPRRQKILTW
jgi:hypothetical protein